MRWKDRVVKDITSLNIRVVLQGTRQKEVHITRHVQEDRAALVQGESPETS